MTHKWYYGIILLGALLCFSACGNNNKVENEATTTEFVDSYNRTIEVPTSPKRVVSTSPSITEIMFALGSGDLLVGRTDYCLYPKEAEKIESIGGISNLNNEKVLSLNPDLVISGSMIPKKSALQLEQMNVPIVCIVENENFEGLYDNISNVGKLIGKNKEADSLNAKLQKDMETLAIENNENKPTLYYVVGFGKAGNFTANGKSYINDIIELAGAENIAKDTEDWTYSLEELMNNDPNYILIRQEDSALFCKTPPYNTLTAVKEGKVIAIESGMIDLQVPRNIDAIKLINKAINK